MQVYEQHSSPEPLIHDQQPLGFQPNRDLPPPPHDSVKQIVEQLHHLSFKEVVNVEAQSSSPIQSIDDEEIKLKRAFDEELYHLTVKQAVGEALQDESLKQAIDREIAASEALGDGLPDHILSLRRFIAEALESNLEKADIEIDGEEVRAEVGNEAKGSLVSEMNTGKENVSSNCVDEAVGDEGTKNCEGADSENGDDQGRNGDEEVKDEVQIDNYESNMTEYVNRESNGWDEDREEYRVNTYDDYRSENGKEEGYNVNYNGGEDSETGVGSKDERQRTYHYPLRPDAEDCSYYMKTGMCKFGSNCKFNHPLRRRNQGPQATKEMVTQREESSERSSERPGQIECKYYLTSMGCKYGKACRYNHSKGKPAVAPTGEFNFLGLPIRPGEKECPYYMRTGSCKYGLNCRFNHPDPTAAVGGDTQSRYNNGGSASLQSAQQTMSSWASPRAMNETTPFVPVMYPPTQSLPPPNRDWNSYQAPVYPSSESGLPTPPAFAMNNPATDTTTLYPHHQRPMRVEEYPERPGEPECTYFLKTGDCKYRSNCRFHHPKNRIPKAPPCTLSDKGLPLRPGQNTCAHYSRYGICKFGPACKYDHPPVNPSNSTWSEQGEPSFGNSVTGS